MQGLLEISGCDRPDRVIDVIFVHGLDGDARTTWHPKDKPDDFWPAWLGAELPDAGIWSLGYDARSLAWKGHSMPLYDRAKNTVDRLERAGIGSRPIGFVCHSLGGLLVKEVLRVACSKEKENWQTIADQTVFIAFLATPHSGADMANWIKYIGLLLRPTVSVSELEKHDPALRQLNVWYRNNAAALRITTAVYCEKQPTAKIMVVDETTADPGIPGVPVVPLDADHITICKPQSKGDQLYLGIKQLIEASLKEPEGDAAALQQPSDISDNDSGMDQNSPPKSAAFFGPVKVVFCDRLGDDWRRLADILLIPTHDQARFDRGDEARGIWGWLECRKRLGELADGLDQIGREDLAGELRKHPK